MSPLLTVEDLTVKFRTQDGIITAVSNATFTIEEQEYYGMVGESGCGKSTLMNAILGTLAKNGKITSGSIEYKGYRLDEMTDSELNKHIRWNEISVIPQGSMSSLDPVVKIKDQAAEIAQVHGYRVDDTLDRLAELFEIMGISPDRMSDYPGEFSGGMQQRAIIALALVLDPSLIIADEPTTALDVIMQDQVFRHLIDLKEQFDTSMILVTHDIALVLESCDRMAVMHSGQIAEKGDVRAVHNSPRHPYTIALQKAFPDLRYPDRPLEEIGGNPPTAASEVDYCTFEGRCPWAAEDCGRIEPRLEPVGGHDHHEVACLRKDVVYRDTYPETERMEP